MKKLRVNIGSVSYEELKKIAEKSGFAVFQGAKHAKVKSATGGFVTLIPRHTKINSITAKRIVEAMNACGAKIILNVA